MEIILIRHFKTPGNLQNKYIGRTDESLAKRPGLEKLVEKLKESCPDVTCVAASPMQRCVQTAALLFPGREPLLLDKLRECDFGMFEGKTYEELKNLPVYRRWIKSQGTLPVPGGESPWGFRARCMEGFREYVQKILGQGDRKAAMVVHGGTIMAVLEGIDSQKRGFYSWQAHNGGGYRVFLEEEDWRQGKHMAREIEKL